MGRDEFTGGDSMSVTGFNPRARMGRDVKWDNDGIGAYVSIHAPAWGATW